jgi:1,4-dihydroxy-2-naphthoate octaprenyltransferase
MTGRTADSISLAQLPGPLRWVIAARLKTVGLSLTPVLCGAWLAAQAGKVSIVLALLAALSAVAIQVGTNLWNDAADAERGTDTAERLGPPRMTALGLLDASAVKRAASLAFATALVAGLPLVNAGGWPIIAIGFASLLLGYAYSMGPWPLSHTPLGEVLVVLFFGVIAVTGTAHVLGADLTRAGVQAGFLMGLPSSAVLLLNNHRDRKTDVAAGRRTLAIVVGEQGAKLLYAALLLVACVLLFAFAPTGDQPWTAGLAALPFLPAALLIRGLWRTPVSSAINRFLPLTVLFQFGLLLVLMGLSAAG